jgi:Alcohol dehydrogenase GroES-like domain
LQLRSWPRDGIIGVIKRSRRTTSRSTESLAIDVPKQTAQPEKAGELVYPLRQQEPAKYAGRSMKESYQHLMITAAEWDHYRRARCQRARPEQRSGRWRWLTRRPGQHCPSCQRGDFHNCRNLRIPGISHDGGYQQYMIALQEALVATSRSSAAGPKTQRWQRNSERECTSIIKW